MGSKNRKAIFLNIVFYRFFNKYNLYENLGVKPFQDFSGELAKKLKQKFKELKDKGKPIFNDAYLIAGKKGEEKYISVINTLLGLNQNLNEIMEKIDNTKTPKESFEAIKQISLIGDFLAYEIWTDLTYFRFFKQKWIDNDFVNIGPGALQGLKIIYGKLNKKQSLEKLNKLHKIQGEFLLKKKNPTWKEISYKNAFSNKPFLSLRNIEHSLCEFRKYYNLKKGKGKRRYFIPSSQS